MRIKRDVRERILEQVHINEATGCWEWMGKRNNHGYGVLHVGDKPQYVHRLLYQLSVGPIPDGLELDHLCRTPHCCCVDHLEPVTHRENTLRGDTVTARNAAKTHCPRGHEYTPDNTQVRRGQRACRICERDQRNTPERKRAKAEYWQAYYQRHADEIRANARARRQSVRTRND